MNVFKGCDEGVHAYHARYHKEFNNFIEFVRNTPGVKVCDDGALQKLTETPTKITYICDICTKCGNVVMTDEEQKQ